jgi:hypothetical protein
MSESIECAARAIHARIGQGTLWDKLDDYSRAEYCADARAAFESIREPSDELIERFGESTVLKFIAVLDAILEGK